MKSDGVSVFVCTRYYHKFVRVFVGSARLAHLRVLNSMGYLAHKTLGETDKVRDAVQSTLCCTPNMSILTREGRTVGEKRPSNIFYKPTSSLLALSYQKASDSRDI